MDPFQTAIGTLRKQIAARQEVIDKLSALRDGGQASTEVASSQWSDEQRRAAGRRAKAQWRKRKALRAQKATKPVSGRKG